MGIRVIGQKKFEVTETELLQQDLLFYLDNPRVYSVLHENGHDNPTQTEIEEIMCSLDHVKSLKSQIMQNGGLIEPLIVVKRKDRYVVLEGNSRLAAYRILAKNDPLSLNGLESWCRYYQRIFLTQIYLHFSVHSI